MGTIISFIGGLSVGETAALALGIVAALLIVPPLVIAAVQHVDKVVHSCTDRIDYDPGWMDAKYYRQMEREERAAARTWRRGA